MRAYDGMIMRGVSKIFLLVGAWQLAFDGVAAGISGSHFETLPYDRIVQELYDLATNYPHLAQVYSAQDRYELPSPGFCSVDGSVPCEQWVLHVSDHASLGSDPERPEVFFSGCLHGDEQVGPTAVLEAAKLMVYAAVCEADSTAKECDDDVLRASPESVPWLARLALTRSTVFMPMTNAIGYYEMKRTENGLDPNRDFPYSQKPKKCMTTITARAVNEVWREHAFQLAVTFHGGMVAIAYEWGSPDHPHKKTGDGVLQDVSPDDEAQEELTAGLSRFAGSFRANGHDFEAYPTGRMNDLVYPVAGGMEDWAYAGSWGGNIAVCQPKDNGGYPKEKTIYNSATLRALNILVEASDNKHPSQSLLGSREGLLDSTPSTKKFANGHIARNVRLTLMVVDLVQPYVQWSALPIETEAAGGTRVILADEKFGVDLEWTVGGAFRVDTTQIVWGLWPKDSGTLTREDWEQLVATAHVDHYGPSQSGQSRWRMGESEEGEATTFRSRLQLDSSFSLRKGLRGEAEEEEEEEGEEKEDTYFAFAIAKVDQSWGDRAVDGSPDVGPQSHFVNARTSEDWLEENAGHVVRGRLQWLSAPLKVVRQRPFNGTTQASGGNGGKNKDEEWGGGYGQGTVPPFEWMLPTNETALLVVEKKCLFCLGAPMLVALAVVAAGLLALVWVLVARARGGPLCGRFSSPNRSNRGKTFARRPVDRGDMALSPCATSADLFNRRRHQETRERGAIERENLLPPIGETP